MLAGLYRGADEYLRASKALSRDFELRAADAEQMVSDWTDLNDAAAAAWSPRCVDGALTTLPRSASPTLRRLEPEAPTAEEGPAESAAPGDSPPVVAAGMVQAPAAAPPAATAVEAPPSAAAETTEAADAQTLPTRSLPLTPPPLPNPNPNPDPNPNSNLTPDQVPVTALRPERRLARCHESQRWFPVKG